MIRRILPAALLSLLILPAAPSVAVAGKSIDFCGSGSCQSVVIVNKSYAKVTRVKIRQLDKGTCDKVNKDRKKDMNIDGKFTVQLNPVCNYRVTFKTSNACTGHKVAKLSAAKMSDGYTVVALKRACGTLKTKLYKSFQDAR